MKHDVLIIGGGIGGLCSALALQQHGIRARVFESAAAVRAVGAGIIVAPNGMTVLDRLGLAEQVRARSVELDQLALTDAQGRPLMAVPGSAELKARFRFGLHGILRAQLYGTLLDALQPGSVIAGKQLVSFREEGAGMCAQFSDGSDARGSLLLGADGINSVVRNQLFPEVKKRYSGQTSHRGVANYALEATAREGWGAQLRVGIVAVSPTQTYWYTTYPAAAGERDLAMPELLARMGDFDPQLQAVVNATPTRAVVRTDIWDLPPLPVWYHGRVCLLGDAAHATTPNMGQGGNQALEDAWVLADQLARETDPAAAFGAFTRIRKSRADAVVRRSRQLGSMVHLPAAWQRNLRNGFLRALPAAMMRAQGSWVYEMNH